jgi:6-phosphogluconolactonase/glucosamine-6-phosphate isomerase/deaminase
MQTRLQKTENELIESCSTWLKQSVSPEIGGLFLPAGSTMRPVYAAWREKKPPELDGLTLLQMDEVIEGNKQGLFQSYFREELPNLKVQTLGATPFSGKSIAILGLGLNGHVAFHEPDMPVSFTFGEVNLSVSSACELGVPTGCLAKSYGLGTFLKCESLLLVVRGEKKREVFQRLLAKDYELPATHLLAHKNLTILADPAAHG